MSLYVYLKGGINYFCRVKATTILFTNKLKNTRFITNWSFVLIFWSVWSNVFAQTVAPLRPSGIAKLPAPTLPTKLPSSKILLTAIGTDSTRKDTLTEQSDIKTTVVYSARDSTVMDPEKEEIHLYGEAKVTYGQIELTADYIKLNWTANEVFARGNYDTTTKKMVGLPIFKDGGESYDTKEIRYNFKSKKGLISGVVTQQGDGNIRGTTVKKDPEDNMYIRGSKYTTCNLEHPHFYIASKKIKMVANKQVISGPFNLVINDIPLPIGLPFGFFPIPKNKEIGTSGILMPTYGEEPNGRGYFLRDGGYYWAISEKFNLIAQGQLYSKGSWGLSLQSAYAVKYRFSGNLSMRFNRNVSGNEAQARIRPRLDARNDFSFQWTHTPVTRGNSSFGASVNIGSNSFNEFNALSTQSLIQNVSSSSVQYNKQFGNFARAGASLRVNQRFPNRSKVDSLGRPTDAGATDAGLDFNFGINQFAPLALKGGSGRWYESFRLGLDFNGGYAINNNRVVSVADTAGLGFKWDNVTTRPFTTDNTTPTIPINSANLPEIFKNAQFTGRYSIPLALPNIKWKNYFNLTPGISLSGELYQRQFKYTYLGNNRVRVDTLGPSFANNLSFSASLNTRIYGMFLIKGKRLEAIRHTLIPTASISYVPDQSNLYQSVQINERGDTRFLNRYRNIGGQLGGVGRSAAGISWSLNNLFEAKIRPKSDSSGKEFEKINLLDNLSLNGNYNLTADSLKASDILLNANLQLFKDLNLNFGASFDPYAYIADEAFGTTGRKINRWTGAAGQGLARLSNVNVAFGKRFAPKGADKKKKQSKEGTEEQVKFINANPEMYVDFNIPWTLNLNYSFNYSRQGLSAGQTIQTLRINGDFSLTPKWKFVIDTGVDIQARAPSITTLTITRDLHCWEMFFNWTPFAAPGSIRASNYSFELRAKSSLLRDLKLSRRRSFQDTGGFR
jgi:LptD protein